MTNKITLDDLKALKAKRDAQAQAQAFKQHAWELDWETRFMRNFPDSPLTPKIKARRQSDGKTA